MKKVLFVLGAFAAMSLVACNGKTDCACDIYDVDGNIAVSNAEATNGSLNVMEFDGECSDVVWADLPSSSANWASMAADGYTLKCKEK